MNAASVIGTNRNTVRKSIVVNLSAAHAFGIFTEKQGVWWPLLTHHIGQVPAQTLIIQPHIGGRWFERGEDGSECDWGRVLLWDPPRRLVLSWEINAEWQHDPDFLTEVEVRFIAEGANRTRVELEHRNLERFGEKRAMMYSILESEDGWSGMLKLYNASLTETGGVNMSTVTSEISASSIRFEEASRTENYLNLTRDKLLEAVSDLDFEQWHFKPDPDRWSIAEIVEHLAIIEGRVHLIVGRMAEAPEVEPGRNESEIDEIVFAQVPLRETKIIAPPQVEPTNQWAPEESVRRFVANRSRTIQLLKEAPHLRGRVLPHQVFGPWDGYQWISAAAGHSARHTEQILEVKERMPARNS